jgi:cell division protein FtsL
MKNKLLYLLITSVIIVFVTISYFKTQVNMEHKIQQNIAELEQSISDLASTPVGLSSSPYDYIKDNQAFENIIDLGKPALPKLKTLLKQSDNHGLIENIYAIAIDKIKNEVQNQ